MKAPHEVIVPIFSINGSGGVEHFLGTGSFVAENDLFLTADHVLRDWPGELAIALQDNLAVLYPAKTVFRDQDHDLALLRVQGYKAPVFLMPRTGPRISGNRQVVTFDYGTTITAGNSIHLSPVTRLGNVTRQFNLPSSYGPAGQNALELSFPALRGASGAPVISNDDLSLQGVIIANVSYHLLPCQIESVLDVSNTLLEETKYMLPQAVAVDAQHISNMLENFRRISVAQGRSDPENITLREGGVGSTST